MTTKIVAVIPNWNGADMIAACIDSLLVQSQKIDVIVVENGSVDESTAILARYGDKITLLPQKHNLGFAGGVNIGIKYAMDNGFDYVALFNNDAIANKTWVKELLDVSQEFNAGIVTCKLLRMDKKTLDSTGDFYTKFGLPYPRGRNEQDTGQYDKDVNVFGASGGASLYSCKMLKNIGLFDNDFFAYYEDVDISFRAQLAGYKVMYAPKALAYHHMSATSNKLGDFSVYQTAKNFWMLYTKNMPGILYFKFLPFAMYWYARMFAARMLRGGRLAFIKGWFKSVILLPSTIQKRRVIQKNRVVSTDYINSIIKHHRVPKPPAIRN